MSSPCKYAPASVVNKLLNAMGAPRSAWNKMTAMKALDELSKGGCDGVLNVEVCRNAEVLKYGSSTYLALMPGNHANLPAESRDIIVRYISNIRRGSRSSRQTRQPSSGSLTEMQDMSSLSPVENPQREDLPRPDIFENRPAVSPFFTNMPTDAGWMGDPLLLGINECVRMQDECAHLLPNAAFWSRSMNMRHDERRAAIEDSKKVLQKIMDQMDVILTLG